MNKIAHLLFNLIFNDKVFDWYVYINKRYFKPRIFQAEERYIIKSIAKKGTDSKVKWGSTILNPEKLELGDYVRIGEGSFLFCRGGISIGDNTQISRNVLIYSANHDINGSTIPYDDKYIEKPVTIGKSVWIGMNVVIRPGVKIGDGAIIGMGLVVSDDVPEGAVVVGAKQRIVKYRDMKDFHEKDKAGAWFAKQWPMR